MKILLGLTGSVAVTVADKLIASLKDVGELKIIATESAVKMADANMLNANTTYYDQHEWKWNQKGDPVLHIVLRDWYDVFVIAPLSCNTLAKMANGICDNLLTTVWMASLNKKVIVAPAMNTQMWKHPIVEANIHTLKKLNVDIVPPISKTLACGEIGMGAMANIDDIVSAVKLSIT